MILASDQNPNVCDVDRYTCSVFICNVNIDHGCTEFVVSNDF